MIAVEHPGRIGGTQPILPAAQLTNPVRVLPVLPELPQAVDIEWSSWSRGCLAQAAVQPFLNTPVTADDVHSFSHRDHGHTRVEAGAGGAWL